MGCGQFFGDTLVVSGAVEGTCYLMVAITALLYYRKSKSKVLLFISAATGVNMLSSYLFVFIHPLILCLSSAAIFIEVVCEDWCQDSGFYIYSLAIISRLQHMEFINPSLPKYRIPLYVFSTCAILAMNTLSFISDYYERILHDSALSNYYSDLEQDIRYFGMVCFFAVNFGVDFVIARTVVNACLAVAEKNDRILAVARSLYRFLAISMLLTTISVFCYLFGDNGGTDPLSILATILPGFLFPGHFFSEMYYQKALSLFIQQADRFRNSSVS